MMTTLLLAALLVLLAPERTVAQIVDVEGRCWFTELDASARRLGGAWQFPAVPGIFKIEPLVELKAVVVAMLNVTPIAALDFFAEVSGMASAGYRIFDARVSPGDDFAKLRLTGPFVGASFRF